MAGAFNIFFLVKTVPISTLSPFICADGYKKFSSDNDVLNFCTKFITMKMVLKIPNPTIPDDMLVINKNLSICCRIHENSCFIYYKTYGIFFHQHEIHNSFLLKVTIIQLIICKIATSEELSGFLNLNLQTINNWVNEYLKIGSKSYFSKPKRTNPFLEAKTLERLFGIFEKNVTMEEVEYLQNMDITLIMLASKYYRKAGDYCKEKNKSDDNSGNKRQVNKKVLTKEPNIFNKPKPLKTQKANKIYL